MTCFSLKKTIVAVPVYSTYPSICLERSACRTIFVPPRGTRLSTSYPASAMMADTMCPKINCSVNSLLPTMNFPLLFAETWAGKNTTPRERETTNKQQKQSRQNILKSFIDKSSFHRLPSCAGRQATSPHGRAQNPSRSQ